MNPHNLVVVLACVVSLLSAPAWAADEPDEDMPGRVVIIKPPSALFRFVSKPTTEFTLPSASNDPTVEGGSLFVFDTSAPQSNTYALPASGWKALGTPVRGYKYKGAGSAGDPCRVVLVKKRVAKAVCRGTDVTLTTPFTGQVGIMVTLGTDSKRYCTRFGGTEAKHDETLLKRSNAPAQPGSCPDPLECPGPGGTCGSCPAGFCSAHVDADPPSNVCANSAVCTPGTCTSDADCSGGQLCVQNPFPPGEVVCCSPCP